MKRYLKDFELSFEFVKYSIYDCLNGSTSGHQRWTRHDTSVFFGEYVEKLVAENNMVITSRRKLEKKIREIANSDREKLYFIADYIAKEMYQEIKERRIKLEPIKYDDRYDPLSKKVRRIGIASMKQQCYDYIAVNAMKKMFDAKIGHYQCASLKKQRTIIW